MKHQVWGLRLIGFTIGYFYNFLFSQVCVEKILPGNVFQLSVSLMDRFLSHKNVDKNDFQLLAAACLLLASKLKLKDGLSLGELCYFTAESISIQNLKHMENLVSAVLSYNLLACPIPEDFLELFYRVCMKECLAAVKQPCTSRKSKTIFIHVLLVNTDWQKSGQFCPIQVGIKVW